MCDVSPSHRSFRGEVARQWLHAKDRATSLVYLVYILR